MYIFPILLFPVSSSANASIFLRAKSDNLAVLIVLYALNPAIPKVAATHPAMNVFFHNVFYLFNCCRSHPPDISFHERCGNACPFML